MVRLTTQSPININHAPAGEALPPAPSRPSAGSAEATRRDSSLLSRVATTGQPNESSSAMTQRRASLPSRTEKPSAAPQFALGTAAAVAVPLNVDGGAVKGAHEGSKVGTEMSPVVGAIIGLKVNSGLSINDDVMAELTNALSAIPEDRISKDPKNGHTIVTLRRTDMPGVQKGPSSTLIGLQKSIDELGHRYDANGDHRVDLDALIAKRSEGGAMGSKIAIKAKNRSVLESDEVPQLCKSKPLDSGTSISIQSNVNDPAKAGLVGLQFVDQLERAVKALQKA